MLVVRIHHVSRPMLRGLTHLYAGDRDSAMALLEPEAQRFAAIAATDPDRFTTLRSLCQIYGALENPDRTREACEAAKAHIPVDAYMRSEHLFKIAVGPALAGDSENAIALVEEALSQEAAVSMHDIRLHPAFADLLDHPEFAELERRYPVPTP